ncbi:RabGAP/TBC [Delitschia confertaspora ATCC 74209]|uniref:RabGAP/TBC n=1 Tax=Delitschia confertaspora ATCC 74209 TaxID=1513339 RepID=A0A9P4MTG1_9PLEO|nr:RabGAP/TBC [Delitschia confertaspora ATCC 74209]
MSGEAPAASHGDNSVAVSPKGSSSSNNQSHLSPVSSQASNASKSPSSRSWLSSVRRPKTAPGPKAPQFKRSLLSNDDARRDSALASSLSTTSTDNPASSPNDLHKTPSLPAIVVQGEPQSRKSASTGTTTEQELHSQDRSLEDSHQRAFHGIDTVIPNGGFDDLASPMMIEFSKRGSMLLGGKRANSGHTMIRERKKQMSLVEEGEPTTPPQQPSSPPSPSPKQNVLSAPSPPRAVPRAIPRSPSKLSPRGRTSSLRVLSADETMLSRKVRAMYRHGDEKAAEWDDSQHGPTSTQHSFVDSSSSFGTPVNDSCLSIDRSGRSEIPSAAGSRQSLIVKESTELAGGVEDWTDLGGGEVDRYGFIIPKKTKSRESNGPLDVPDMPGIHRVSTALMLASTEPRRRRIGRSASKARSARSVDDSSPPPKRNRSKKSKVAGSVRSNKTTSSRAHSQNPFRYAANRLPHNKDRRLLDEAGDMLTLPPGLAQLAEKEEGGKAVQAMKAKEIEREEKWRKMAKVIKSGAIGGGMMFEFDTKDQRLISRTWKGIPDKWRATAWYAFLAASAKSNKDSATDEELMEAFYELQEESCADDMQIDVDVPRTINRHIMFRRRYRGGQRLLFRVLHAMSLYLPDTGYVQGMAPLAATLLCYYEEDKAFVMLVRLWQLRGLEKLYETGFAGLMEALDDFEKNWLRGGDIAQKLEELGITSTAYGTRWYLTLFNYSIPFPAQLRVWDVFMLLGDASNSNPKSTTSYDLDVLHATSAALIDGMRDILLDSDFENAMKVLTSWIPIKDEDLLMRVAKAEYRMRKKRAHAS